VKLQTKLLISVLKFTFFIFLFGILSVNHIYAANFQFSGSVKDNTGTAVSGATVYIYTLSTTNDVVPPTTTDQSGNFSFSSVPQGTYDIKVTPPLGSNFSPILALNQNITSNTVINFV